MKKDAYYFPHYCNARSDRKIKRLIKQLGVEGYGIFFMILETLREQTDFKYPIEDIDLLADEFGTSETKVRAVVTAYDLFSIDENTFFSPKQVLYLQPYLEKSQRARDAARLRWDKVNEKKNAFALPEHSKSIANQNASKVKESKVKKSIYTSDFEALWIHWSNNIKNGSNKKSSFDRFKKLSENDQILLFKSIQPYSISNKDQNYLKRCETYISQRHWEQVDTFAVEVRQMGDF